MDRKDGLKHAINLAVGSATGYEFRRINPRGLELPRSGVSPLPSRASGAAARLLPSPVFVYSSVRSGSTLLRVLLNSHPQVFAPHEVHLRHLKVQANNHASAAMQAFGLDQRELEHLLWDRVMHHELEQSGKQIFVNKTPGNALMWRRIAECWPEARYIFLLRHPLAIALSWQASRPKFTLEEAAKDTLPLMRRVEEARAELPGLTLHYENITVDPVGETQRICSFLHIPWKPTMLEYGDADHGNFTPGLGDWTDRIRSGQVQPARPLPPAHDLPSVLRKICASWGYSEEPSPTK